MALTTLARSGRLVAQNQSLRYVSTKSGPSTGRKVMYSLLGTAGFGAAGVLYALENSVSAMELVAHAPKYQWPHGDWIESFDARSIRRGYEVFKQVCAACHSLKYIAYRNLVGVSHTEEEAKAEAAEVMVTDGPDESGEMFQRPGKLSDLFQPPYPNEEAARHANNGAYPPDLSLITNARHGKEDYLFALLTGYCDPPAGVTISEGQAYNPYFPGGAIGMPQMLYDEVIEYSDGTPATASQLAKDVSCFLKWATEPEHDQRQRIFWRIFPVISVLFVATWVVKRSKWSSLKTRKIVFTPKKYD
ncbi:cytochrome c1, heme protein, mitochondrial [Galendromus occidentalis]|uniref:Cytochrome c1, heme protein, mitochondrial n=1 Tax=Galendromus occidentalis TaxID=34638 RepID=A0AAJ6W0K9_9ACAR|nr:cytochrome c1, heme protein, mitochondrial [Galendromus occidentalis]XP_018496866.1 cytochrome c1, heme protein, mitochondrial [Galendromus occidentalis]